MKRTGANGTKFEAPNSQQKLCGCLPHANMPSYRYDEMEIAILNKPCQPDFCRNHGGTLLRGDAYLPPGQGRGCILTHLSCFQHFLNLHVLVEYEPNFLYILEALFETLEQE